MQWLPTSPEILSQIAISFLAMVGAMTLINEMDLFGFKRRQRREERAEDREERNKDREERRLQFQAEMEERRAEREAAERRHREMIAALRHGNAPETRPANDEPQ